MSKRPDADRDKALEQIEEHVIKSLEDIQQGVLASQDIKNLLDQLDSNKDLWYVRSALIHTVEKKFTEEYDKLFKEMQKKYQEDIFRIVSFILSVHKNNGVLNRSIKIDHLILDNLIKKNKKDFFMVFIEEIKRHELEKWNDEVFNLYEEYLNTKNKATQNSEWTPEFENKKQSVFFNKVIDIRQIQKTLLEDTSEYEKIMEKLSVFEKSVPKNLNEVSHVLQLTKNAKKIIDNLLVTKGLQIYYISPTQKDSVQKEILELQQKQKEMNTKIKQLKQQRKNLLQIIEHQKDPPKDPLQAFLRHALNNEDKYHEALTTKYQEFYSAAIALMVWKKHIDDKEALKIHIQDRIKIAKDQGSFDTEITKAFEQFVERMLSDSQSQKTKAKSRRKPRLSR